MTDYPCHLRMLQPWSRFQEEQVPSIILSTWSHIATLANGFLASARKSLQCYCVSMIGDKSMPRAFESAHYMALHRLVLAVKVYCVRLDTISKWSRDIVILIAYLDYGFTFSNFVDEWRCFIL